MAFIGLKSSVGVLSVALILAAVYYKRSVDEELQKHLDSVLGGLLRAEKKVGLDPEKRVAVGFGACQDIVADGIEVLNRIGAKAPKDPEHYDQINSREELEKVFAYFFRHGAAAERYVQNETFFLDLVDVTKEMPEAQRKMGGNAPVMAMRLHKEGLKVMLGSQMTPALRKEMDPEILVLGEDVEEDDIHLLLEYAKDAEWGHFRAPRANRFIVHNDDNNPTLNSIEEFSKEVREFEPSLLVVGGLQMLDNYPFAPGQRKQRLGKLTKLLATSPLKTKIHFEMASFAEEECLKDVIESVIYYTDSLGMNEQELPNLFSVLTNGSVTLLSDPYPRIATTLDQMREIYKILSKTEETGGKRKLTRLHVHTLAYQAIMTTKGSSWKNSMSAAAKASLTANRHVCDSKYIHTESARILMDESFSTSREGGKRIPFKADRPVSCWDEDNYHICIAPVLVCTKVVQTGGGGDNVSSAGLVLQI